MLFASSCKQTEMHDEEAIYSESEAFRQARNKGDARRVSSFSTDDAIRVDGVGATGVTQRGRAELETAYERLFRQTMPGAQMKYPERGEVRMLSPELAVWQGNLEVVRPDGTTLKGHVVEIFK